jgi:putative transposase
MLTWKLRQEGILDNHKRVRRLYRLEGLAVRRRGRKRVAVARVAVRGATAPNEHWAMDFVRDTRADGRAFRALTLVDACTRECPVIEVGVSLGGARVVVVLERLRISRGLPSVSPWTTGPSFGARRSMPGRIGMACSSSSVARGSPWTTPSSRRSTAGCATSA